MRMVAPIFHSSVCVSGKDTDRGWKKMQIMIHRILLAISLMLNSIFGFAQEKNTDSALKSYIIHYKPVCKCNDLKVSVPRFPNIDSEVYFNIEKDFLNDNFSSLYLLLVAVYINHNIYINKFEQEYIINDGLTCQDNSIIKLIRIVAKSNKFLPSLVTTDIETTGDILYWANKNKDQIDNYSSIDIIGSQKTISKRRHRIEEAPHTRSVSLVSPQRPKQIAINDTTKNEVTERNRTEAKKVIKYRSLK